MQICVIITDEVPFGGLLGLADKSEMTALVAGSEALADKVAKSGVKKVLFFATDLAENVAVSLANAAAELSPNIVLAANANGARVLAGAVAAKLDLPMISGVRAISGDGVRRVNLEGRVVQNIRAKSGFVAIFDGEDTPNESSNECEVISVATSSYEMSAQMIVSAAKNGLMDAERVVSFGKGVKNRADIQMLKEFADQIDAQLACSMPIADDFGWMEHYIGRSGQKISPRLAICVGISGAPQHLEGINGAVIVAINSDPEARIFKAADYGIVGDLYEIIPALKSAL